MVALTTLPDLVSSDGRENFWAGFLMAWWFFLGGGVTRNGRGLVRIEVSLAAVAAFVAFLVMESVFLGDCLAWGMVGLKVLWEQVGMAVVGEGLNRGGSSTGSGSADDTEGVVVVVVVVAVWAVAKWPGMISGSLP